jgi:hypothetical protein
MSAFKPLLASDIVVTPFEVNKSFRFIGNELTGSSVEIERYIGKNILGNIFDPNLDPTTGTNSLQYQRLVYNSVKELYYSNYLSSSYGSSVNTASLVPGEDTEGDVLVGTSQSDGRYVNYNQSTLTFSKYFPTASNSTVGVLSVPSRLYGNYILPNSFTWSADSGSVSDDGEGNLINNLNGRMVGQIFYPHGMAILTNSSTLGGGSLYGVGIYGQSLYGLSDEIFIDNLVNSTNVTCSFSSSITIYETQYKCTIKENEFNFSLNPSILSGSINEIPYSFIESPNFSPYVTTVGLYNDSKQLLAVGKLSQPLPTSPTTDTTIVINLDM